MSIILALGRLRQEDWQEDCIAVSSRLAQAIE